MRICRIALLLLAATGLYPSEAAAQTIPFRARLIHVDGLPTAGVTVGFGALGSTVARGNGQIETAVPVGTREVEIDILDREWAVLYPRSGRVPIPLDPTTMPEIVVGESIEAATLRLFAERHERLAADLTAVGAGQDEIREILEAFVGDVSDRLDVEASRLESEIELQRQRAANYPKLSETISAYVLAARDLNNTFGMYGEVAFTSIDAHNSIYEAAQKYNAAFERLNNERLGFEYQVATYWESEELRSDLRALFDYALGEVHRIRILSLNEVLPTMYDAATRRRRDRAGIEAAQERIRRTVADLELHLAELDRRSERVLGYLSRN